MRLVWAVSSVIDMQVFVHLISGATGDRLLFRLTLIPPSTFLRNVAAAAVVAPPTCAAAAAANLLLMKRAIC
jgi:hypothetical protein